MENKKTSCVIGVSTNIQLNLTEMEARALHDIVAYGTEAFLEVFYAKLGKAYLCPHEAGIKSLFKTVRDEMPNHFHKIDEVYKALEPKKQ